MSPQPADITAEWPITSHLPIQIDGQTVQIPIVEVTWHDERTGCERAHRYLAGQLSRFEVDLPSCPFYQRAPGMHTPARCTMNGRLNGMGRNPCLFTQAENHPDWANVRRWRMIEEPDGTLAICRAEDAAEIAADLGAVVIGHLELTAEAMLLA